MEKFPEISAKTRHQMSDPLRLHGAYNELRARLSASLRRNVEFVKSNSKIFPLVELMQMKRILSLISKGFVTVLQMGWLVLSLLGSYPYLAQTLPRRCSSPIHYVNLCQILLWDRNLKFIQLKQLISNHLPVSK